MKRVNFEPDFLKVVQMSIITGKKSHTLSHNISKIIACSFCNKLLIKSDQDFKCNNCDLTYSYNASGSLDLRLKKQKSAMFEFKLGDPTISEDEFSIEALKQKILPEVDFSGFKPPYHLTKEILRRHLSRLSNRNSPENTAQWVAETHPLGSRFHLMQTNPE